MSSERLCPMPGATRHQAAEPSFLKVPRVPRLDVRAWHLLHSSSVSRAVPYGGGSRGNRPAPILMNLPSRAGSEEEFLLLEICCLQTIPEASKAVRSLGRGAGTQGS